MTPPGQHHAPATPGLPAAAPPGAPAPSPAPSGGSNTKKILLGVGGGCLGLVLLCCLSGVGLWMSRTSSIESAGQEHAELLLSQLQSGNWEGAFRAQHSVYDYDLYTVDGMRTCFQDTALGDMTAYECDDASLEEPLRSDVLVECTITSASRGEQAITLMVNSADDSPYFGFTWFETEAAFGTTWAGNDCATYSGREYFESPPENRVRPSYP